MRDTVMRLTSSVHILNNMRIAEQELLPEEVLLLGRKGQLRNEFSQVVKDEVLALRMEVGIERSIHEPHMYLILDDIELPLVSFWGDLCEAIG